MAGYVTLDPASGVSLRVHGDVVHVALDQPSSGPSGSGKATPPDGGHHAAPSPSQDPPAGAAQGQSGGGVRIGGPRRRPLDVWTTFVSPELPRHERDLLEAAPHFNSLAELAASRGHGLLRSKDGHTLFARVKATGAIPISHIDPILEELPDHMHLVVAVEPPHGR